jgi:hypothetical protein
MTLDAATYFGHLRAYLNDKYITHDGVGGEVVLKEKFFADGETKARDRLIRLKLKGDGLAFKLDHDEFKGGKNEGKGNKPPLFHFLDDQAKPWSKRCDFVVFHVCGKALYADCIEFKSKSLNAENIVPQLKAGVSWCRSLKRVIEHYTTDCRKIRVRKFVFADNANPAAYLNPNRQLLADPSVRYYHFDEVNGQALADLQNVSVQEI